MIATVKAPLTMRINGRELPAMEHQRRFLNIESRHPLLVGGFGCGKSHILLRKALQACAENPGLPGIYACLTYGVLRDAILPEMFDILRKYDLVEGRDWNFNSSSMTLTLPIFANEDRSPASILFRPVESKLVLGRMRGITAAWGCLDEAAYMSEEAFRAVSERVRHPRARRLFVGAATTPEGFNWVYDKWVTGPKKRAAAAGVSDGWVGDEQYRYVRGRTTDNPHLDPGYVESLRAQYDERLVDAYLEGEFVPMFVGRCFRFSEQLHSKVDAVHQPHLPIRMAWDFNVDPMSVSLNHYHKGQLWTFDEIVLQSSFTEDVCERFLERYGDHLGGVWVYGDAGGKARSTKARWTDYEIMAQMLGHMADYQEHVPRANPSQRESVNTLNALFKNGFGEVSYSIHPRCVETIKSLLTTVWDPDTQQIYKGEDSYEHLSDGLRYLAWQASDLAESGRRGAPKRTINARGAARV